MVKDDTSIKINQELEEIRKSESFLASLLENSSQPFGVGYPDGRLGLVNKAFEKLTGYSREELKNTDWSEILTPDKFRDMEKQKLVELQRTGQPVRYEKEYIKKDGTRVPIELLVHIVKKEDGTPEYYYSFITDISERKISEKLKQELLEKEQQLTEELTVSNEELQSTSEELQVTNEELMHQGDELLKINKALELSKGRYRNIIDNLQDAYLRADKDGNITMASPSAVSMYRYDSPQDIMGSKALSFYKNPEDRTYVLGELKKQGKVENNEVKALRKDGTSFIASQNAQFYFDENGQVQGTETLVRDITEQKTAEYELKVSEEKYRNIVELANEGIIIVDQSGIITYSNAKMAEMLGYTIEELIGKDVISLVDKEEVEFGQQKIENRKKGIQESYEIKCRKKNGEEIWFLVNATPMYDNNGKHIANMTMETDITERKKAEEALNQSQKLLQDIIDGFPSPIFVKDIEGRFLTINKKLEELLGVKNEELIG